MHLDPPPPQKKNPVILLFHNTCAELIECALLLQPLQQEADIGGVEAQKKVSGKTSPPQWIRREGGGDKGVEGIPFIDCPMADTDSDYDPEAFL